MEQGRSPLVDNDGESPVRLLALLQKTSRTFALTIPLLPEPLRSEVATAYLLFRIIDTFEDATRWEPSRRVSALGTFVRLIDLEGEQSALATVEAWVKDPPVEHAGYLDLLSSTQEVIGWYRKLRPAAAAQVKLHVTRSARAMMGIVARTDERGVLALQTLPELRDYCFAVAGIVGEMLTELFLLQSPSLEKVAGDLRARAVEFGEALQLVNILKDSGSDAADGRIYLPRAVGLAEVFQLARADLRRAVEYIELLRTAGADRGVVAFNALNTRLAIGTLKLLRDKGTGAKLTRLQVTGVATQVMNAVETGGALFPESL